MESINVMFYIFVLINLVIIAKCDVNYSWQTEYIDVPVDHFSFTTNQTFKLRYLINDTFYANNGPIFFYTGNEGEITNFAQNTGFMFDIAPQFNALLVFAEHRYYGTSLPFGNLSYTEPKYLGYLTSSQALADFVFVIDHLQTQYAKNSTAKRPVVLFGGSYGGMLAAWFRIKYPSSSVGAIAASAPIWQFKDLTPCENFNKIITDVFRQAGTTTCTDPITKSWELIRAKAKTANGLEALSSTFRLCSPLKNASDVDTLVGWITNIYANLAMVNYPYSTSFLAPLPPYPVREFCSVLNGQNTTSDDLTLTALSVALEVYTNYTKDTKCNDILVTATSLGETGWNFQACTEIVMPMCSVNGDMFETSAWNFDEYAKSCVKQFGVGPPREDLAVLEYGGKNLKYATNIVFSNGLLDPWSSGGVLANVSSSVYAVLIPDGAHHADLRGANPADSEDVKQARNFHVAIIATWLDAFYIDNNL